jgi:hypothetical protein
MVDAASLNVMGRSSSEPSEISDSVDLEQARLSEENQEQIAR